MPKGRSRRRKIRREREEEIGDFSHHAPRVIGPIHDEIPKLRYSATVWGAQVEGLKTLQLGPINNYTR
jgi:hypothetical protein